MHAGVLPTCLASTFRATDGIAALALLLFALWGARRGAVRQILSLGLLATAFATAGRMAGTVAPTVEKVLGLGPAERLAFAWAAVVFAVLVAGAIALRLLAPWLPARARGGADRTLGALLGATKGAVVLVILGTAVLGGTAPAWGPPLSRAEGSETAGTSAAPRLTDHVSGSFTGYGLTRGGDWLARLLDLPPWIRARMEAVHGRLGERHAAPPREVGGGAGGRRPRGV